MLVRLSPLCVKQLKLLRPPDAKQNRGPAERVRFWEEERRSKRETAILKRIVVANDMKSATTMHQSVKTPTWINAFINRTRVSYECTTFAISAGIRFIFIGRIK